jgi:hypothetical protein
MAVVLTCGIRAEEGRPAKALQRCTVPGSFASHPDGSMTYNQFVLSNSLMSPQEIDRDRKNMSAVELGLERGCGLSGLHSRVTEKVTGWQPESSLRLP